MFVIPIDVEWVQTWVVAFLLKHHTLFSETKKYKRNLDYISKKLLNSLYTYSLHWLYIFATFTTLCAFLATCFTDAQGNSLGRALGSFPREKIQWGWHMPSGGSHLCFSVHVFWSKIQVHVTAHPKETEQCRQKYVYRVQ
jgi:hypothetical protein